MFIIVELLCGTWRRKKEKTVIESAIWKYIASVQVDNMDIY
jgi:hypothetical protein